MTILSDLRLDIADEAAPSGVSVPQLTAVGALRLDIGDDEGAPASLGVVTSSLYLNNSIARFTPEGILRQSSATLEDDGTITTPGGLNVTGIINGLLKFRIATASGPVTITNSDNVVFINKSVDEITTVSLPDDCEVGHILMIKDFRGNANAFNIVIVSTLGSVDGDVGTTISSDYGSATLIWTGSDWGIIS